MPGEPIPFFGRAFKLQVIHAPGTATQSTTTLADSTWKGESLRIEFETEQVAVSSAYWNADISVYNSTIAMQAVLQKGDSVSLIAGYDSEQGVIFEGKLWQPLWDRPDSVTNQLKLRCFVSLLEMQAVYVTVTVAAGSTQLDAVKRVADAAGIKHRNLDEAALSQTIFPRGRTVVGDAMKFFCEMAKDNGLQCWLDFNGLNLRALSSTSDIPDVVYAPPNITSIPGSQSASGSTRQTLTGTPEQTEMGVEFTVLLDSTLTIGKLVKLDQSAVRLIPVFPGQIPSVLSQNGLYIVAGLRHIGDSRGNPWHTRVIAVNRLWSDVFRAEQFAAQQ